MFYTDMVIHINVDQNMVIGREPRVIDAYNDMIVDYPVSQDIKILGIDAPDHLIFQIDMTAEIIDVYDPVGIRAMIDGTYIEIGFDIRTIRFVRDVVIIRA